MTRRRGEPTRPTPTTTARPLLWATLLLALHTPITSPRITAADPLPESKYIRPSAVGVLVIRPRQWIDSPLGRKFIDTGLLARATPSEEWWEWLDAMRTSDSGSFSSESPRGRGGLSSTRCGRSA